MGSFIAKQPNGLICRFSTIVGCPTNWNMTEKDYIEFCKKEAEEAAKQILKYRLRDFDMVKEYFHPGEMSDEEFEQFLKDCNTTAYHFNCKQSE